MRFYGLAHPKRTRMALLNFQCPAMGTSLFPPTFRRLEDDSGSSRRNHTGIAKHRNTDVLNAESVRNKAVPSSQPSVNELVARHFQLSEGGPILCIVQFPHEASYSILQYLISINKGGMVSTCLQGLSTVDNMVKVSKVIIPRPW